jgi:RHS repeat-associated protein
MGHSTKYGYDNVGRMTRMEQYRVIDETYAEIKQIEMQVTTWERNKRGDILKKTAPLDGESSYRYDPLGNLISQTDEEGLETLYEYNLASTLTKVAYADGKSVELSYNPIRQLTELKDWLGTTTIELDPVGRATKTTDHEGQEIGYTWDAVGRRESITYPDKTKVNYSYDISGRINEVVSETGITKYNYSISDRLLERIMPGNIITHQKTDSLGRIESLTHKQNDEILDSFKYCYDQVGNITQIEKYRKNLESDSGIFSYAYDKLGRLTEAANNNKTKEYHYDSLGNRIMSMQSGTKTLHSYNSRNQLIKTTEGNAVKDYSYDKRGNLTGIIENGITTSSFVFNSANRMVEAITSKGKAEYEYNGFLKRVSKLETLQCNSTEIKDPLSKVKYTLDLTKPYNDLLSIGEQRFVWGNELLQSEGSDNNEQFSYLNDHLGSPIRLVGNSLAETLSYDEFGVPLIDASTSINSNASKHQNNTNHFRNPFGFTGYQSDNITDLYYAQARYYNPSVGRFGATDVIKGYAVLPITLNEYAYCINNPKKYVDLDGEFFTLITAAVGAVAGAVTGGISSYVTTGSVCWGVVATGAIVGGVTGFTGGVVAGIVAGTVTNSHANQLPTSRDVTDEVNAALRPTVQEAMRRSVTPYNDTVRYAIGCGMTENLLWFYNQVDREKTWDIKLRTSWEGDKVEGTTGTIGTEFPGVGVPVTFRGHTMTPEQLGNYTYGYIGAALGLELEELRLGSTYAAFIRGESNWYNPLQWIDELCDWCDILRGFNDFERSNYEVSGSSLILGMLTGIALNKDSLNSLFQNALGAVLPKSLAQNGVCPK